MTSLRSTVPPVITRPGLAGTTLPSLTRQSALLVWRHMPRCLAWGLVVALAGVPWVAAALSGGDWWMLLLCGILPLLLSPVLARAAATVAGDHPRFECGYDAGLSLSLGLAAWMGGALVHQAGVAALAGFLLTALVLYAAPMVLAYGAVRGRRGLAAVRGGLLLLAHRPAWGLTLFGLTCLTGFFTAASGGTLVLLAPMFVMVTACRYVTAQLQDLGVEA